MSAHCNDGMCGAYDCSRCYPYQPTQEEKADHDYDEWKNEQAIRRAENAYERMLDRRAERG